MENTDPNTYTNQHLEREIKVFFYAGEPCIYLDVEEPADEDIEPWNPVSPIAGCLDGREHDDFGLC